MRIFPPKSWGRPFLVVVSFFPTSKKNNKQTVFWKKIRLVGHCRLVTSGDRHGVSDAGVASSKELTLVKETPRGGEGSKDIYIYR